jgi:hypothetical protein
MQTKTIFIFVAAMVAAGDGGLPCWQVRRNGLAAGGDEKGAKMNHLWSFF